MTAAMLIHFTDRGFFCRSLPMLLGLARPSARVIIPELQELAVGDVVPLSPDGKQGSTSWPSTCRAR